jgi:hypothetical protein
MKMKIPDDQAIYSLIKRGARHHMVIAWWHLEDFKRVEVTPGHDHARPDKNALAIEIFAQYMAQLETLEMTYFALRAKAADSSRSFLEHYERINIKEHFADSPPPADPPSGALMLSQLKGMDVAGFRKALNLASHEEVVAGACGKEFGAKRITMEEFDAKTSEMIRWLRDAVENKRHRAMHRAFMKVKHGGLILTTPDDQDVYLVQDTYRHEPNTCGADVLPFNNTEEFVTMLAEETRKIGGLAIQLLSLFLAHSPFEGCGVCTSCEEQPTNEPTAASE